MTSIDCHKEMSGYHADEVTLGTADQADMRSRRDAGRTRLKSGLTKAGHPLPKETHSQGSYSMRTMVQDDQCDYDIDDGVYFEKDDLKDGDDNPLGAYTARDRVKKALKDERLNFDAVIKNNCVRQRYPSGYHIDIPVYRILRSKSFLGEDVIEYELASGDDWVKSDARAVTRWYNGVIGQELKSGDSDRSQTRRITKLTKKMARSRLKWKAKTTSGICITRLVVDEMKLVADRDDVALRGTWMAIKDRLDRSLQISHPVLVGKNLAEWDDEGVNFFRSCLESALNTLQVLDDTNCTRKQAREAWDEVFNTNYFTDQPSEDGEKAKAPFVVTSGNATQRNDGGRRFG